MSTTLRKNKDKVSNRMKKVPLKKKKKKKRVWYNRR